MKYRNTATQIKEIPIVFRGSVNAGSLIDPDATLYCKAFTTTSDPNTKETNNTATQTPASFKIGDADYLYIEYNGVYYGKITKQTGSANGRFYGAAKTSNPFSLDYSIYPFCVHATTSATKFSVYVPYNTDQEPSEVNIKIWREEPEWINKKKTFSAELTGNGQIKRFHARFACGENGTLHLNPYVILNGNITIKLCDFAKGGDDYIAGDNEEISFDCYVPVETHALVCLDVENVGEYTSIVDAAVVVQYEDFIEPESIVGYEGINLNRRK